MIFFIKNSTMKNVQLLLSFLFLFSIKTFSQNGHKTALIVGVSNYSKSSGWMQLNATNDVELLKNTLTKRGFQDNSIHVLQNEKATHRGIVEAIQKQLIDVVQDGDVAYFHFSGHGQQIEDRNHDEIDGYDEALVPFDSPKLYEKGKYEGENLLIDDELEKLFTRVREKLGKNGHLFISIDACHSGTGTRGFCVARGTTEKMASTDYIENHKNTVVKESLSEATKETANMASMTTFFSANAQQLSYECTGDDGKNYGAFSYTFSKILNNAKENASYQGLYDQLKVEMLAYSNKQIPQMEGAMNNSLFGGKLSAICHYFLVKEIHSSNLVTIQGGILQGLHEKTLIAFYPIDTRDTNITKPIAIGEVRFSTLNDADVNIENGVNSKILKNTWAMIQRKGFYFSACNLNILSENEAQHQEVLDYFRRYPLFMFQDKQADYTISLKNNASKTLVTLYNSDEVQIYSSTFQASDLNYSFKAILEKITLCFQAKYLRQIENSNDNILGQISIVNASNNSINTKPKIGDVVKLKVENKGKNPFYFSILDIQPDNVINIAIPNQKTAAEYYLLAGKSFISEYSFTISAPIGTEVLKLIATAEPIEIAAAFSDNNTKGRKQALSTVLSKSFMTQAATRGQSEDLLQGEGSITTYSFSIQE
jgi:metacaspase-1